MAIFMPPNKYGYCVNIGDPRIREKYEDYKRRNGLPHHFPISDKERLEFEEEIKAAFSAKYPERAQAIFRALHIDDNDSGEKGQ